MSLRPEIVESLTSRFGATVQPEFRQQTRIVISPQQLLAAMQALRDEFGFDYLVDVTCVDYLHYRGATDRFGLVYLLSSTVNNDRLTVRVMLNEPDLVVLSMTSLWEGANWFEREVYDMYGIRFDQHPDLRRILLPEEFTAFPLRKDYPLQGRGERHNFPVLARAQG
jgi:NADH-quinone oxidoreductase subunit C